jgi:hypothetical protein
MKQTNKLMAAFIAIVVMVSSAMAQAPQKMSYQSVIRNASGALIANQAVGVKISLLQGSATGTAVYVETQNPTTNANGLASFQIGGGTVVSGNFASINWAAGPYFVKTETDPTGGSNYSIAGTTQLLSVAYALYAANSGTQGAKGDSGVSIRNTKVNGDSLFVTLSNGQTLNAGNVRGLTGATGANGAAGQSPLGTPNDGSVVKYIIDSVYDKNFTVPAGKVWRVYYPMGDCGNSISYFSVSKNGTNFCQASENIGDLGDIWLAANDKIKIPLNFSGKYGFNINEYPDSLVKIKTFVGNGTNSTNQNVTLTVPNGKTWKILNFTSHKNTSYGVCTLQYGPNIKNLFKIYNTIGFLAASNSVINLFFDPTVGSSINVDYYLSVIEY